MSHTEERLDRATPDAPRPDRRWVRGEPLRAHRAVTIAVIAAAVVVAVGVAVLVFAVRGPVADDGVDLAPQDERAPASDEEAPRSPDGEPAVPDPAAAPDPAGDPEPAGPPEPVVDAAPAEPARIEVRDQRLYLVDADGRTLRTLHDAHDGSQEYTLRNVTLRPGSTTQDLAVAFVEGYMTGALSVLAVRDGGAPEVMALTTVDFELHDQQPMALPAGVWSPDGGMLAWLEPDAANRAVLRAVRWSAGGPAGDATPTAGVLVDPEGLMAVDETRGLELVAWGSGPSEHLTARAYRPFDEGAERHYTIGVRRDGGQLQAQPLTRS